MLESHCKTCGGRFSHPELLQEHWDLNHKDKECARCGNLKPKASKTSPFCPTCESDLNRPHRNLSLTERLQKQLLRAHKKAQKWENLSSSIRLLLDHNHKTRSGNGLNEYCGHGEKRGRCQACNPIFEKITEKSMAEARAHLIERLKKEAEKGIRPKKVEEVIEVILD